MFDSSPGVHARIVLLASRADPAAGTPRMPARSLGSRACSFSTCSWLLDYAGPDKNSRLRSRQCGLPVRSTRSAPDMRFSKLDSRPVNASVYASPGASRRPAQDSRSRWFATPFLWGSFIPDCTPVYPDDCAPSRPWLRMGFAAGSVSLYYAKVTSLRLAAVLDPLRTCARRPWRLVARVATRRRNGRNASHAPRYETV
jgi:hypothetical protein